MRFLIVTGMSGAGKSSVLKMLEDAGYFCVDNLPIPLVGKFAELATSEASQQMQNIALGIDVRSGDGLSRINEIFVGLELLQIKYEILFLECSDMVLIRRYRETRRNHPLSGSSVAQDIEKERKIMRQLKSMATYIIDTSQLLIRELKQEINKIIIDNVKYKNFYVTVLSFGFKFGMPADADLVFDVRFLPNPFYIEDLKHKTGNDTEVYDYVMKAPEAHAFLDKIDDLIRFLIPYYINEGKNQLVIGIGCTGGKHRSVTIANALHQRLQGLEYGLKVDHRDILKR